MTYSATDHTFVICAYGESPFLGDLVESVMGQEVLGSVLVSTSTPNKAIRSICDAYELEMTVNDGASSIAKDWNHGYDSARTPLVTIAHQDDYYDPGFLRCVLSAFGDEGRVGLVHTGYYEIRNGSRGPDNATLAAKRLLNRRYAATLRDAAPRSKARAFRFGNFVCCPSVTFDRNVVGPTVFDERYANNCDYLTWINLANRGVVFEYVPYEIMGHRIHADSTTSANIASNVRTREDAEVIGSLWPKPIGRVVASLYSLAQRSNASG